MVSPQLIGLHNLDSDTISSTNPFKRRIICRVGPMELIFDQSIIVKADDQSSVPVVGGYRNALRSSNEGMQFPHCDRIFVAL